MISQVGVLEPPPGTAGSGQLRGVCAQQRLGGKLRAWTIGAGGSVAALDEAPVSRGVSGGQVRPLGHELRALLESDGAQLLLQVCCLEEGCMLQHSCACCPLKERCVALSKKILQL